MYKLINRGLVECGNGVMVKVGHEHITYIKNEFAVGVAIERLDDRTLVILADTLSWRNPKARGVISLKERNEVLNTIQNVLSFMKEEYELDNGGKQDNSKFRLPCGMADWILLIILSLVSGCVGLVLGYRAQAAYIFISNYFIFSAKVENPAWLGGALGIVFGVGVGAFYILRLIALIQEGHGIKTAIKTGVLAGLVYSSLVQVTLMLFYRNFDSGPLLIGALCGIISGALFGLVAGMIFVSYYSSK